MKLIFREDEARMLRAKKIRFCVRCVLFLILLVLVFYAGEVRMASLKVESEALRPLMDQVVPNMTVEAKCRFIAQRDEILRQNRCYGFVGYRWAMINGELEVDGFIACLP